MRVVGRIKARGKAKVVSRKSDDRTLNAVLSCLDFTLKKQLVLGCAL